MPLVNQDLGPIVMICQGRQNRVRYGVLGAAISSRVGNPNAVPKKYAQATVRMLNTFLGGMAPAASWVVGSDGYPTDYGAPPNPNFDPNWHNASPFHESVDEFLDWLDAVAPGWDAALQSTYP